MKRFRKLLALALMLSCLMMNMGHVSAADELLGTTVDGSLLTEELEAEGIAYPRLRGVYLSRGSGSIVLTGKRTVQVGGSTTAYQSVGKIKVKLYLQRLEGGSWITVQTWGPVTVYNDYYVSTAHTYSVTGGYYYRVAGVHSIITGSTTEAIGSYTDGIWVS